VRVLLRRRSDPWNPRNEQYEWRRVGMYRGGRNYVGKTWYLIRGEDIKPVTRTPEAGAFMRELFNRLRAGETVEVDAEYNYGAWGRSLTLVVPLLVEA